MYQEFSDTELVCVDCKEYFAFSAGEREFYADKQLSEPKRCKSCRTKKKMNRENQNNEKND